MQNIFAPHPNPLPTSGEREWLVILNFIKHSSSFRSHHSPLAGESQSQLVGDAGYLRKKIA